MPSARMRIAGATCALAMTLTTGCDRAAPPAASSAPSAPPAMPVDVVVIEPRDTPMPFEFIGRTASSQRVEIRSRVNGYLERIAYTEGEFVENGALLFEMDRKPFEAALRAAKAELAQQEARQTNAKAQLDRIEPLAAANAVAQKELDDAIGSYHAASASVEAASARVFEAELELGYTKITSPVTGLTSFAGQREGAYIGIAAPDPLTYVARIDPLWIEFSVSEMEALRGRTAEMSGSLVMPEDDAFEVEIILGDGSVHPYRGRISFADVTVSERTGTFQMRAVIPNPDLILRPGQYVRIKLYGAVRPAATIVPLRAVRQGSRGEFVYVVAEDNTIEQRPVMLGTWMGDAWIVQNGLAEGDRVIVDGVVGLAPGAPVTISKMLDIEDFLPEDPPSSAASASPESVDDTGDEG